MSDRQVDQATACGDAGGESAAALTPISQSDTKLVVSSRQLRFVFAALMLSMGLAALDQSIVNTALPQMASDLRSFDHMAWVVTAFMLTSTAVTPLYGKLSDIYGRRSMLVVSISLFLISSILCGLALTMPQLILFRALQGLGAGGLITLSQTVIGDLVSPRERGRYQGLFSGAFAVATIAGPLIGGALTSALSWRWVFYVNVPIGGLALLLILIGLPGGRLRKTHHIDYAGAALLAIAATCTLALLGLGGTLIPWLSMGALALAIGACLFSTLFLMQERRAAEPIIDLTLFHNSAFRIGNGVSGLLAFAMMATLVFLPLYLQLVRGMEPASTGLMMLPQIGAMVLSSIVGGHLISKTGRVKQFLVAGTGLQAIALLLLATVTWTDSSILALLSSLAILGLGMGISMPNTTVVVQNTVQRSQLGVATATMSFVRSLASAAGVAVAGGLIATQIHFRLISLELGVNPASLIEGGLQQIASLPPVQHIAVIDAYRDAISSCFAGASLILLIAMGWASRLGDISLGHTPGSPDFSLSDLPPELPPETDESIEKAKASRN